MSKTTLPPRTKRKDDCTKKSEGLDDIIKKQLQKEKNLYPLRVSKTTVIYVTKDKLNEQYAKDYYNTKMKVKI